MGVRRLDHSGFQRHMVRFQRRDVVAEVGDYAPEVILLNSHDRSSGYQLHAGLFRFVCRNGMMVAHSLQIRDMRLVRASLGGKIPAASCHLYSLTPPKVLFSPLRTPQLLGDNPLALGLGAFVAQLPACRCRKAPPGAPCL
jgi:hypothetical protein